jgi:hypothetical protein
MASLFQEVHMMLNVERKEKQFIIFIDAVVKGSHRKH